jgi:uncharacterized OB-fold protein
MMVVMGNVCVKSDVDEFDEFRKKLKHLKIPKYRVSDNGECYKPPREMSVNEFRQAFEKSPYNH